MAKYVIVDCYGKMECFIFPKTQEHRKIANRHGEPVSAGFCDFDINEEEDVIISCHGRSESLNLASRPEEDSKILTKHIINSHLF